ncbi:trypsin-like serine protease [Streptomyces sp. NPDC093094]|uniref:trypsin-like serine protease n=1 Tax=Streptomyces sp. NPDC093094 TaxID=3366026 RepID=UPI0037F6EDB1
METSTPEGRRRSRRMRIALPATAAAVAVALAAFVLAQVAGAAPAVPEPTVTPPGYTTLASGELERRVAGAVAGDDTAGPETPEASESSPARTRSQDRAPGGTAPEGAAPWMAQLWYHDDRGTPATSDDLGFFCSGAVVAPTKILTAAHCVKGYNWYAFGAVVTGTAERATAPSGRADLHGGTASLPLRQYYDPSYSPDTFDNDIAVLTLDAPVRAEPIRLTTATETAAYRPGTPAEVYGWGRATGSAAGKAAAALRTDTLPLRSDAGCAERYGDAFVADHMVCTGGTAQGDPGAPLVVGDRVVGVVSGAGHNRLFTKVRKYIGTVRPRIDDANFSRDHRADLFARRSPDGTGFFKASKGSTFDPRDEAGNWGAVDLVVQTDLDRDGFEDVVWRRHSDGDVHWAHYVPAAGAWRTTRIAEGWSSRTQIVTPGDVTGDDLPDLLSVDASGVLWIYPGKGDGTFAPRVRSGSGWNAYDLVLGHGDFTDDGRADLITRGDGDGRVSVHQGTGEAGPHAFADPVEVRTWKDYDLLDAVGDVNGDSRADLLARGRDGTLYLYKGTGRASSEIFETRVPAAPDFDQYDLLG